MISAAIVPKPLGNKEIVDVEYADKYEIEAWIDRMGSAPVRGLCQMDLSESYTMCKATVFELRNGTYALVTEEGCSCYHYDDAQIDLHPTLNRAMDALDKWRRENSE